MQVDHEPPRALLGALAGVGAVACAPAAWWIGDLAPDEVEAGPFADYAVEPPAWSATTGAAVGIAAFALVVVGAVAVRMLARWSANPAAVYGIVVPGAVVSAYAGLTYAVLTAPVNGANIGAGLMVFGAVPVAIACLGVFGWSLARFRA